ncbi:unnamed protein product [Effrenium voratum]|nr:unnamed protein product [Effrenium voratum]
MAPKKRPAASPAGAAAKQTKEDPEPNFAAAASAKGPKAELEALPKPVTLPLKSTALVCIDFQKDFMEVGGFGHALGNDVTKLSEECLPGAATLLAAARSAKITVVHTKEAHREDLRDCCAMKLDGPRCPPEGKRIGEVLVEGMGRLLVDGSKGNEFMEEAKPIDGEIVVAKPGKGGFFMTGLHEILREKGISHLIFCGVTTEVCVNTTMREANDRGYECVLVADATGSYFPQFKAAVLEMVRSQGGIVGYTVEEAEAPGGQRKGRGQGSEGCNLMPAFPPARCEGKVRGDGVSDDASRTNSAGVKVRTVRFQMTGDLQGDILSAMDTYDEAEKHLDNGDLQLAVRRAEDALSEAQAANEPPLALHLLVRAKQRLGSPAADLVKEAKDRVKGQSLAHQAAAQLASVVLCLGDGRLSDANDEAKALRAAAAELTANARLHRLALAMQVTVQLARGALDDAMRASMELLAAAQRGGGKPAEAAAWLRIAEVHRHREMAAGGGGTSSTPEETLQAAERSAELYRGLTGPEADASQKGLGAALTESGRACLRLGRHRQAVSSATEAMAIFRPLDLLHRLTRALDLELEARRGLMEPMIGLQAANRELQLLRERQEAAGSEVSRGALQAEAEILEAIARTHGSLSEPLGAVRNGLLAADLRKEPSPSPIPRRSRAGLPGFRPGLGARGSGLGARGSGLGARGSGLGARGSGLRARCAPGFFGFCGCSFCYFLSPPPPPLFFLGNPYPPKLTRNLTEGPFKRKLIFQVPSYKC